MSHATVPAPSRPAPAGGFRVLYHPPVCPDCASDDVITEDIETGDGLTEAAHICRSCGTAWPVACITEWRVSVPAPATRPARPGVAP